MTIKMSWHGTFTLKDCFYRLILYRFFIGTISIKRKRKQVNLQKDFAAQPYNKLQGKR